MTEPQRIRRKIVLDVDDAGLAQAVTTALEELIEPFADAVSRFQVDGAWRVEAYYTALPDPVEVTDALTAILGAPSPALSAVEIPDENWVAISQAALPPVVAGRFTVHGSHDRDRIPRGPWAIEIDAGEAFGTAHHATTLGCLMAIDALSRGSRVHRLHDLGCGSGVLAIAAKRVWPRARVSASDIDPEAVRVARENTRRNRVPSVAVSVANGLPRGLGNTRFDVIVANILAGPLVDLAPHVAGRLRPGGSLVLSGLLIEQAPVVRAAYRALGFCVDREVRIAGWSTLVLRRRRQRPLTPRATRRTGIRR